MCSTLIIGLRHSACLAPVNCSCLTAFVGQGANLLMYLQEPPRGDGASSSVNFVPGYKVGGELFCGVVRTAVWWRTVSPPAPTVSQLAQQPPAAPQLHVQFENVASTSIAASAFIRAQSSFCLRVSPMSFRDVSW